MTNTKIKVVGVGGSGSNAITRMKKCNIEGVELIALNTDAQDLQKTKADLKIRIGKEITKGLGAGMNPEIGEKAAEENRLEITEALKDSDLIFITYGAGGGTGTGAGPVVAKIAKNLEALTIAIVTRPFSFEGSMRRKIAEAGLLKLKGNVDSLITISNDKLLSYLDSTISPSKAFWICDDVLRQAVQGISDLIMLPGIINVDFADVKSIIKGSGSALFGVGQASGEKRAENAVKKAINASFLDLSPKGATGILFNVSGYPEITLSEIDEVAKIIGQQINSRAKIIFGAVRDEKLKKDELKVMLIAAGF